MLKLLPFILLCCLSFGCKKAIESKQEKIVMDAITSGFWRVELYSENGAVMTSDYSEYEFKFNEDETLNAHKTGSAFPGTWKPDISQYTITTNFPGANDPLKKLSSIWKLTDSDWDYVRAETSDSGIRKVLHLRKK